MDPAPGALETQSLAILRRALDRLDAGFRGLPQAKGPRQDAAALERVLLDVAERLQDNYPYFHPLYAGQMLKPPHPVARLAYALAMWLNPNNHALDGGRASSAMEKEAVAELARMIGWEAHLGHLCGGGTMANLEALWVAGQLRPGAAIVASTQAHYTHGRISGVLGLPFEAIACDRRGRLDKHDSPYTYFSSTELHLGEISLECSRPGAAAVALWATQRLLPLGKDGDFARGLAAGRQAALTLYDRLTADRRFVTAAPPELDILVWAPRAARVSEASSRARRLFDEAARRHLHLALAELPVELFDVDRMERDRPTLTCLRSVLMKSEHREWLERTW